MSRALLVGVFVGGGSRRMGGAPKGMLAAPDGTGTLVERALRLGRSAGAEVVLVGASGAFDALGVTQLADAELGAGPLAGLVSLLTHAGTRPAVALACDLPVFSPALLERLATHAPEAAVVAARDGGRWNPLFARYDPARVLGPARAQLTARLLSLQPLLVGLAAAALPMEEDERSLLVDWDCPADLTRG